MCFYVSLASVVFNYYVWGLFEVEFHTGLVFVAKRIHIYSLTGWLFFLLYTRTILKIYSILLPNLKRIKANWFQAQIIRYIKKPHHISNNCQVPCWDNKNNLLMKVEIVSQLSWVMENIFIIIFEGIIVPVNGIVDYTATFEHLQISVWWRPFLFFCENTLYQTYATCHRQQWALCWC